jgi:predicted RND superfamily exporter protein
MDWFLSSVATILAMVSMWLYGNKSWKAPLVAMVVSLIWTYYFIHYKQIPLLIPTFVNIAISIRNYRKMKKTLV